MSRIRLVEIGAARAVDRTPRPSLLASAGVPILVAAGPHGHDATIYANVYARVRRRYASGDQHLRPSARRNRMERREELRGGGALDDRGSEPSEPARSPHESLQSVVARGGVSTVDLPISS